MSLIGRARRVRVYLTEARRVGSRPASEAVVDFLRREGAAGATVLRPTEGFGGSGRVHTARLAEVAPELPIVVEWIDSPERVERLLPRLVELVGRGLVTVDDTEVVLAPPQPVHDVPDSLTVGDAMSRDVQFASPATPVRELVERMLGRVYRALPIVDNGRVVGIVTNTDLITRGGMAARLELLATLESPERAVELEKLARDAKSAADVMTPSPFAVSAEMPLSQAAELMAQRRHKRLPVVSAEGRLVGMLSRLDLLRAAAEDGRGEAPAARPIGLAVDAPVSRAMRREAPAVHPDTPFGEAFQAVISTRLNRAIVVDAERRPVGVVTDEELLDRLTPALRPGALRSLVLRLPFVHARAGEAHAVARDASELMSGDLPTVREDTPLSKAIAAMLRGSHKLVAVVDAEGRLVGELDRADVLRGLVEPRG